MRLIGWLAVFVAVYAAPAYMGACIAGRMLARRRRERRLSREITAAARVGLP